jgi:hypothetical protein
MSSGVNGKSISYFWVSNRLSSFFASPAVPIYSHLFS